MGLLFSHFWHQLFGEKSLKLTTIGLDNAGKTTILYKLHLGEVVETQPTIGCNVETVKHGNVQFQCWDCSGQENARKLWPLFLADSAACILVVDSTDRQRMAKVKEELWHLLSLEELHSAVLLVFANKQEVPTALPVGEIAELLSLSAIQSHSWNLQPCCALTGEGLSQGLEWISQKVKEKS